ncbi:CHAP domain-containing protein [Crenobacter intestini]|uniref:CHAP domain-containing protein n=1 Tax=Crenobacter intestini TaxID=2563443 RepID=A0A4T0V4H5_9NEIS|nr:CHAP domain-containing protein [Crenobacter intestini]TIC86145.1 CHAP domain-containing protein [Crenobacter intestini]
MKYPGRVVRLGEADPKVVKAVKEQLNKALHLPQEGVGALDESNPNFGATTEQVVKLFQCRNADALGRPLLEDGEIGALTWAALFGEASVPVADQAKTPLLQKVVEVAASQVGVREVPKSSNRGPQVEVYLASTGTPAGSWWCCAFTYWCFREAATALGVANPMLNTAHCLTHWNGAKQRGAQRVHTGDAVANPALVKPGMLFILDKGGGNGHTGVVERVAGEFIYTIEGNSNASGGADGDGVYRLRRKIDTINKGFIDYA